MSDDFSRAVYEFKANLRRYRRLITVLVIVIGGIMLVESMFYSVQADEEGVVLRFGEHIKSTSPGLHFKWPWPIDEAVRVPIQKVRTMEFGSRSSTRPDRRTPFGETAAPGEVARMLTGDLNLAHVEWIVQYRIHDAAKYLFQLGGARHQEAIVEDAIRDVSESVMRRLVGDVSVDDVLTTGRDRIAGEAKREVQQALDEFDCGITIVTIKLQTVSPPDPVKDAFDSVNRARQNKERAINEARGERNRLVPEARGKRDRAIAEAEGYMDRVVRTATGRANAFRDKLREYEKAPEVTRIRLYLETMEEVLAQVGDVVILDESVRGVLPLLNLDRTALTPVARKGGGR